MPVTTKDMKLLCLKCGNCCAFPDCRLPLVARASDASDPVVLGEVAHIVAQQPDGPRGNAPLSKDERDCYDNLILLCARHHQIIDAQPEHYTVDKLHAIKDDHEAWVARRMGADVHLGVPPTTTDSVFSNLLPVIRFPEQVFGAPCDLEPAAIKESLGQVVGNEAAPFVLREGQLFAFTDLRRPESPFAEIVAREQTTVARTSEWEADPDRGRWLVSLLNRCLNKFTGRRGLYLDKDNDKYFFPPKVLGQARKESYRPPNQRKATRNVAWEPRTKATKAGKGYWVHRAVQLRFLNYSSSNWALSLRPGFHVTQDGAAPLPSDQVGRRVTRLMAKTFNYDYLGEIQFWRDYLGRGRSFMLLTFGSQRQQLAISTNLLEGTVAWPGIPTQFERPFRNIYYEEDPIEAVAELTMELPDEYVREAEEEGDADDETLDIF